MVVQLVNEKYGHHLFLLILNAKTCNYLGRRRALKASHAKSFSIYSMLEGSNGPLITSMDWMIALAGRTLFDGSDAVRALKQDENPCMS